MRIFLTTGVRDALCAAMLLASAIACGGGGTVAPPATATVTSVVVSPATPSISVGQSVQLNAAVSGTNNPSTGVTWQSGDVSKVTVSAAGVAVGVAAGAGVQVCAKSALDAAKTGCASVTVTSAAGSFPSTASVTASAALAFTPAAVDIAAGGTVGFTFASVTHNVNFGATAGAPANVPNTASAVVSRQFNTAGTFAYQCTLHAGMTGSVIVH